MAKVQVVYLKDRDGHAAGEKAELEEADVHELMRQGVVRWLEAAPSDPPPATVAPSEPSKG